MASQSSLTLISALLLLTSDLFVPLRASVVISTTDCDVSKGCFRPACNCTQFTCKYLVTYRLKGDYVNFEVAGKVTVGTTPYFTMGIGDNKKMGNIYTIGCYWNGTAAVVQDGATPPLPDRDHNFSVPPNNGVVNVSAEFDQKTATLSCAFSRARDPGTNKDAKDLRGNVTYFLFAAAGPEISDHGFGYHKDGYWRTKTMISFGNYTSECSPASADDDSFTNLLYKIHGSLMLAAWAAMAAIGVLLGLHYRITITNTKLLGSRAWLKLHRALQIAAVAMTAASFVVIFVAVGELHIGEGIEAAHPIIGIMVMSLAIINGVGIFSRKLVSAESTNLRKYISNGHLFVGRLLLFLSAANLITGLLYDSMNLDIWPVYVVGSVIAFTFITEITLYAHASWVRNHNEMQRNGEKSRLLQDSCNGTSLNSDEPKIIKMKGNPFRVAVLVVYAIVGTAATAVIISAIFGLIPRAQTND